MDWKLDSDGGRYLLYTSRVLGANRCNRARNAGRPSLACATAASGCHRERAIRSRPRIGHVNAQGTRGLQLKATESQQTREIAGGQAVPFASTQADWSVTFGVEKLDAIGAEVFNLVTVGDGLLGSATIRLAF